MTGTRGALITKASGEVFTFQSGAGFTDMISLQRLTPTNCAARPSSLYQNGPAANDRFARLIHFSLALYLLPVLLVVLAVGALGIAVLGCSRMLTGPVRGIQG